MCKFIDASISIYTKDIQIEQSKLTIPFIHLLNETYDADQGQDEAIDLPLIQEMIFMRYEGSDESDTAVIGFLIFYPSEDICYLVESEQESTATKFKEQISDFDNFE